MQSVSFRFVRERIKNHRSPHSILPKKKKKPPKMAAAAAPAAVAMPPVEVESTLDEPVLMTIFRDLKSIGRKCLVVLLPPLGGQNELRDWDLWGPLVLCIILATTLGTAAGADQSGLVFTAIFVIVWLGSGFVTLNAQFLGGTLSFF
jgi:hypothetical protein